MLSTNNVELSFGQWRLVEAHHNPKLFASPREAGEYQVEKLVYAAALNPV
jgi:hypothetical protein